LPGTPLRTRPRALGPHPDGSGDFQKEENRQFSAALTQEEAEAAWEPGAQGTTRAKFLSVGPKLSCTGSQLPSRYPWLAIDHILLCVAPLSHLVGFSAQSDSAGKFSGFVLFGA
jgi:hypothetical protein